MGSKGHAGAGGWDEVSERIASLKDGRGERLAEIRRGIRDADPERVEAGTWKKPANPAGVPVWSHDGIRCTGESCRANVRLTFGQGASLRDPKGLFNASLRGNALRAIVLHEDDVLNERASKDLVRAAVGFNASGCKRPQ